MSADGRMHPRRLTSSKTHHGDHCAWWGSTTGPAQRFMYRIHGPSILIEYVRQGQGSRPLNHVHAIVRDPRNDYGEDWLGKHYREQPHP